jgi:CubicO group peptidase (beta-lactamase class C family)
MPARFPRATIGVLAAGVLALGCTSSDEASEASAPEGAGSVVSVPGEEWDRVAPEEMGFDPAVLEDIADDARRSGSNCLVVTRRGVIVGEWYWNDTDAETSQEVFSATKSFTSTLVGIAADRGDLAVDEPAAEYLPEWEGGPSAEVTIENLLSNDSGREWSLSLDYGDLIQARDKNRFAIELGQDHEPGTSWAYNNAAIQTLDAVLEEATGRDMRTFAREHLLDPIGMEDSTMTTDEAGNTLMFMGLHSTCEDMARFGHLFLQEGAWGDEQVVSAEWVRRATTPSQELTSAYGYLWWLNRPGPMVDPTVATGVGGEGGEGGEGDEPRQIDEGAPEDMFWARGLGGQIVAIDPGSETVVVRLAPSTAPEDQPRFGTADTTRVVTEALIDAEGRETRR